MRLAFRPCRLSLLPLLAAFPLLFGIAALRPAILSTGWQPPTSSQATSGNLGGEFVAGELLVKLWGDGADVVSSLTAQSVTLKGQIAGLEVLRLGVPAGQELEIARQLRELPGVEWVEPNYLREVMRDPADRPYPQLQWGLRRIQAEQAWGIATGSPEVIVAVLDTGIDRSHPDLAGKLVAGYDFLNDDPDPDDDSGHGTFNAGVIGATSESGSRVAGVARGVQIMPIKVLDSNGKGPNSAVAQGLVYAVDHGARIVNMSFGNPATSQMETQAIRYAHSKGAVLVAAAGNTANLDNAVIYPAAHEQVLAVAATDEEDNVPDFSQHHPYVAISAPGVGILSTYWRAAGYGNYAAASGTSAAAPHVAGLAALILSANPSLSNDQVKSILQKTAEDLGVPGRDEYYGAGVINAFNAVLAAKSGTTSPATATPAPARTAPISTTPAPATATPVSQSGTMWYFAEGSTASPFDLWLLLQNPNAAGATARVTYMKRDGSQQTQEVALPPASRRSIFVNQLIPETELSMKVESDRPVFAERSMYSRSDGHGSAGVAAPSTQ
ncbi:MAG: S8 family serine peptidase, partial [Chloroflexota bacterium]